MSSIIGIEGDLGVNVPNYSLPLSVVFGIEILTSALLMSAVLVVVYTKDLRGYGALVIGAIVGTEQTFAFHTCYLLQKRETI